MNKQHGNIGPRCRFVRKWPHKGMKWGDKPNMCFAKATVKVDGKPYCEEHGIHVLGADFTGRALQSPERISTYTRKTPETAHPTGHERKTSTYFTQRRCQVGTHGP